LGRRGARGRVMIGRPGEGVIYFREVSSKDKSLI
jgi:hypothetical protein